MKINKTIFAEIIFVFASVLIFRSTWLLLDEIHLMNQNLVLAFLLIIGTVISVLALSIYNASKK